MACLLMPACYPTLGPWFRRVAVQSPVGVQAREHDYVCENDKLRVVIPMQAYSAVKLRVMGARPGVLKATRQSPAGSYFTGFTFLSDEKIDAEVLRNGLRLDFEGFEEGSLDLEVQPPEAADSTGDWPGRFWVALDGDGFWFELKLCEKRRTLRFMTVGH